MELFTVWYVFSGVARNFERGFPNDRAGGWGRSPPEKWGLGGRSPPGKFLSFTSKMHAKIVCTNSKLLTLYMYA